MSSDGKLNEIEYEGGLSFGQRINPSTFFLFIKKVREIHESEYGELGKTLIPTVEAIDV